MRQKTADLVFLGLPHRNRPVNLADFGPWSEIGNLVRLVPLVPTCAKMWATKFPKYLTQTLDENVCEFSSKFWKSLVAGVR